MTSLHISLPDQLKKFIQKETKSLGYSTPSEYVRELIRTEIKRRGREKVEALILEGLDSGPSTPMTREDWQELRRKALARLSKNNLKKIR